jgi:Mg/Co/Ni transporter MgtE
MSAIDRSAGNRRVLWLLVLTAAALFAGSVLFIASRAQT